MKDLYIGIENELSTFDEKGSSKNMENYISDLETHMFDKDIRSFRKSHKALRTEQGLSFYSDGNELEICTPPVAINKGFATRLTDLLEIGRNHAVEAFPQFTHTGYSMHWNISDHDTVTKNVLMSDLTPVNILFGLTPLSSGVNFRLKGGNDQTMDNSSYRFELLTDHINNIQQVNAHALFLGAYALAQEKDKMFPLGIEYPRKIEDEFFNGRFQIITAHNREEWHHNFPITIQQHVEALYKYIKPFIDHVGTEEEIQNLEDFITGKKQLEFDKYKYYSVLNQLNLKPLYTYMPATKNLANYTDHVQGQDMVSTGRDIETPTEGKFFGLFVTQNRKDNYELQNMSWKEIHRNVQGQYRGLWSTEDIYRYAARKLKIKNYRSSQVELPTGAIGKIIPHDMSVDPTSYYDSKKDTSALEPKHQRSLFRRQFKEALFEYGSLCLFVGAMGLGLALTANSLIYGVHSVPKHHQEVYQTYEKRVEECVEAPLQLPYFDATHTPQKDTFEVKP